MGLSVEPEKLLVVQLKELLNDAGVPYPKNARKAVLVELVRSLAMDSQEEGEKEGLEGEESVEVEESVEASSGSPNLLDGSVGGDLVEEEDAVPEETVVVAEELVEKSDDSELQNIPPLTEVVQGAVKAPDCGNQAVGGARNSSTLTLILILAALGLTVVLLKWCLFSWELGAVPPPSPQSPSLVIDIQTPPMEVAALTLLRVATPTVLESLDKGDYQPINQVLKTRLPSLYRDAQVLDLGEGVVLYFLSSESQDTIDNILDANVILCPFPSGPRSRDQLKSAVALLHALDSLLGSSIDAQVPLLVVLIPGPSADPRIDSDLEDAIEKYLGGKLNIKLLLDLSAGFVSSNFLSTQRYGMPVGFVGLAQKSQWTLTLQSTSTHTETGGASDTSSSSPARRPHRLATPAAPSTLGMVSKAIALLERHQPPLSLTNATHFMLQTLARKSSSVLQQLLVSNLWISELPLMHLLSRHPVAASQFRNTVACHSVVTLQDDRFSSPVQTQAQCDVRMLPGQSKDEMERWLRRILRRHALQDVDVSLSLTLENGDLAFPSADISALQLIEAALNDSCTSLLSTTVPVVVPYVVPESPAYGSKAHDRAEQVLYFRPVVHSFSTQGQSPSDVQPQLDEIKFWSSALQRLGLLKRSVQVETLLPTVEETPAPGTNSS